LQRNIAKLEAEIAAASGGVHYFIMSERQMVGGAYLMCNYFNGALPSAPLQDDEEVPEAAVGTAAPVEASNALGIAVAIAAAKQYQDSH
jgi:hypothetical protein